MSCRLIDWQTKRERANANRQTFVFDINYAAQMETERCSYKMQIIDMFEIENINKHASSSSSAASSWSSN